MERELTHRFIKENTAKVFADDTAMDDDEKDYQYVKIFGISNDRVKGADYLKRQLSIIDGEIAVFSLAATTSVNLVTQEFGGKNKIILDKDGLPKHTVSAAGVANLVSVASSLASREGVIGSQNPLRRHVFAPLIMALEDQPVLDSLYAKMLNMFEGTPLFLKLSQLLSRLNSGNLAAFKWLRDTVLFAMRYWKENLNAKGLPLQMLLDITNNSRLYLTEVPRLKEELMALALQEQFVINVPVNSLRSPSMRGRALIDEANFGFPGFVPPVETIWDPSLIIDKSFAEQSEQFGQAEEEYEIPLGQFDDDEAFTSTEQN
jgi:hypothetical protein